METSTLQISDIRLEFQPAENLLEETVQVYIRRIEQDEKITPPLVRFDGGTYFLQDGFHRVEAAKRCGVQTMEVEVLQGTLEDMEKDFQEYLNSLRRSF